MATLSNVPGRQGERVVVCLENRESHPEGHERMTQRALAEWLAFLKGARVVSEPLTEHPRGAGRMQQYFVPSDTLDLAAAHELGIGDEHDLFGGVVPHRFVATKMITHPLVPPRSTAPSGWQAAFGEAVCDVVLPGYSAFALDDALAAGELLLSDGAVRLKLPSGTGGMGQSVVHNSKELKRALEAFAASGALEQGVVLEQNMRDVATLSVGQVRVDDILITYHGVQHLALDNGGAQVYGGSDLVVVRGDFDALLGLPTPNEVRVALDQARIYHAAALQAYPGLIASRCNYDIAQGIDPAGRWRSGVLEQSWRMGGASGAELAAIQSFISDPDLRVVRASTTEAYGADVPVPSDAKILYSGLDPRVGHLTKYVRVECYDDTRRND